MKQNILKAFLAFVACFVQCGCSTFGDTPDNFDKGRASLREHDFPRAIEHLRRFTEDHPNDEVAWYNLGIAYQDNGQLDHAVLAYERALAVAPSHARSMVNLAFVYHALKRSDDAEAMLKRACDAEDTRAFPLYSLGYYYEQTGKHDLAGQNYRKALEREPKNALAHYRYAGFLAANNDPEKALLHYRLALESAPDDLPSLLDAGKTALTLKQWGLAASMYEQALLLSPTRVDARIGCARALIESGDFERATVHLWAARDLDPVSVDVTSLLTRAYAGLKAEK
ncbi:MAG: tetratricopeptide repeat protein [Planctomycetes bacterium]|nr:tetratricopeptide repeat protein [Planctomycetota bacterium]NUQ35170.1 tetratricopeptide repeat protein [Planctomycetaceae bacterium]